MKKIKAFFSQLKTDLAPMSWKERLDHLWTYYKGVLLWVFFGIALIAIACSAIAQSREQQLFAGVTVNIELTEEAEAYLNEGLRQHLGATNKRQTVSLESSVFENPETAEDLEYLYVRSTWMTSMVIAEALDYALMDQIGTDFYIKQGVFTDLRNLISQEQYAMLEPYVIWSETTEHAESYPIAIDLSHTEFAKQCNNGNGKLYVAFPGNSERAGNTAAFLAYLLAFKSV